MDRPGSPMVPSVLDALATVRSTYLQRACPQRRVEGNDSARPGDGELGRYLPCAVVAIVSIDAKGRIAWPPDATIPRPVVELGTALSLEVRPGQPGDREPRLDGRGRLRLPHGLMKAVHMQPGDRVVIVRQAARDGLTIIAPNRLGVLRGAP